MVGRGKEGAEWWGCAGMKRAVISFTTRDAPALIYKGIYVVVVFYIFRNKCTFLVVGLVLVVVLFDKKQQQFLEF